jgi:predicted transposase YbfD/YdcC
MGKVVTWQAPIDLIELHYPKARLKSNDMGMKQGTIIDATLIAATSSTKNEKKERDPEMHQTSKDKQWYCGMKVHIGVDRDSGLIHSVETTAAHVHDLTPAADLLHGEESVVYADAGYQQNRQQSVSVALGRSISILTSIRTTPDALLRLIRQRWSIENEWHWARDAQLGEDAHRYTYRTAAPVFSFLRTVVMILLRRGGYRSIRQGLRELTYDIKGMLALGGMEVPARTLQSHF